MAGAFTDAYALGTHSKKILTHAHTHTHSHSPTLVATTCILAPAPLAAATAILAPPLSSKWYCTPSAPYINMSRKQATRVGQSSKGVRGPHNSHAMVKDNDKGKMLELLLNCFTKNYCLKK